MLSMLSLAAAAALSSTNTTADMSGRGFSSDTQQVSQQQCFNAAAGAVTGAESHVALQTSMSFNQLQDSVKRDIRVGFGFGVFDVGAEAGYLRSVMDTDFSLSLNYYQFSSATVNVQMKGTGQQALTPFGQQMYTNNNDYFRVVCGDNYLTSFKQGAMLMMGLNVVLRDREQRNVFSTSLGVGANDIVSATLAVKTISEQQSLTGHVIMGAYQLGGNPNELTKILSKDSSGNYYVLSCTFDDMDACQKAANGLLDYATTTFSKQFDFATGQGMAFLGQGFFAYQPTEYIGLSNSKSFVTSQVTSARQTLANKLAESRYYVQNFYPIYASYPVPLSAEAKASIKAGYQSSMNNVNDILNYATPQEGATGCFDTPDKCVSIESAIAKKLVDVTANVNTVAPMQYMYPFAAAPDNNIATFFYNGTGYGVAALPKAPNGNDFRSMGSYTITAQKMLYSMFYKADKDARQVVYNGTSTDNGAAYTGIACHGTPGKTLNMCMSLTISRVQSPFYFAKYSQ